MPTPPTKQQILEKYRDVIEADDFELLVADDLPGPSDLQKEGGNLEKLGEQGGFTLWLKRSVLNTLQVFALYGGAWTGIGLVNDHVSLAYEHVSPWVQAAMEKRDQPATGYAITGTKVSPEPPEAIFETSGTYPTTTTSPPPRHIVDLPDGSGLVPYAYSWGILS